MAEITVLSGWEEERWIDIGGVADIRSFPEGSDLPAELQQTEGVAPHGCSCRDVVALH